jgi:hypothetical protein
MDRASGGLLIMQLSEGLNNLSHNSLDALEPLFPPGIRHPILARRNGLTSRTAMGRERAIAAASGSRVQQVPES